MQWLASVKNGCFNIVVHDHAERRTLFLSDRFGFLPLYLLRRPDGLWFASDLESLRRVSPVRLETNPVGLAELYWFGYQIGNRTVYRDVQLLPRGCALSVRWDDGIESVEYLPAPYSDPPGPPPDRATIPHDLVELMTRACARLYNPAFKYGNKLSGGMDSRLIGACWPHGPLYCYTYGQPGSMEVRVAAALADRLGYSHRLVPVEGEFFPDSYLEMFQHYGIMEFVHELLTPYLAQDGVSMLFDGIIGDITIGGVFYRQDVSMGDRFYSALGLRHQALKPLSMGRDETAEFLFKTICVGDEDFPTLQPSAKEALAACKDSILHDIATEVASLQKDKGESVGLVTSKFKLANRTRRYVSLGGTTNRIEVQTLYPFLDADLFAYARTIPEKDRPFRRVYFRVYSEALPQIRSIPSVMTLIPFVLPRQLHLPGRVVRSLLEKGMRRLMKATKGKIRFNGMDAIQWNLWLALNPKFRSGITDFLRGNPVVDPDALQRVLSSVANFKHSVVGTRLMLSLSYCAWHQV